MSKKKRAAKMAAKRGGAITAKAEREGLRSQFRAGQRVATSDGRGRVEAVRIIERRESGRTVREPFVTIVFEGRHRRTYPEHEVARL